jgi:hypothetical protein
MTTIKLRRDTAANWATKNPVLADGEPGFITDKKILKIGDGTTTFNNLPGYINDDAQAYLKRLDNTYQGVDLSVKFASEIAGYDNVWAWIKARIQANNFEGIHVGDYIPVALSAGTISDGTTSYSITAKTLQAQIAGIDTYYQYGYPTAQGHHIDFITKTCIGTNIPWNPTDNNNGTADNQWCFPASKIYACLNGINNYTTNAYNSVAHGYDASGEEHGDGGVLQLLPSALQNVITMKRLFSEKRYSASGLLTESTAGDVTDWGKLWLPTEVEVYGFPCNSMNKDSLGINRSAYGSIQYPLFANNHAKNKNRVGWWLSSVAGGTSSRACFVGGVGDASTFECTTSYMSVPVCFRIS